MSGPIVRTGTTPEFWKNYDRIFGDKKTAGNDTKATAGKAAKKKTPAKAAGKSAKKKVAKKGKK